MTNPNFRKYWTSGEQLRFHYHGMELGSFGLLQSTATHKEVGGRMTVSRQDWSLRGYSTWCNYTKLAQRHLGSARIHLSSAVGKGLDFKFPEVPIQAWWPRQITVQCASKVPSSSGSTGFENRNASTLTTYLLSWSHVLNLPMLLDDATLDQLLWAS